MERAGVSDPSGKICLICFNVYRVLALDQEHTSMKAYLEWVNQDTKRHNPFMSGLDGFVVQHNANPDGTRSRTDRGTNYRRCSLVLLLLMFLVSSRSLMIAWESHVLWPILGQDLVNFGGLNLNGPLRPQQVNQPFKRVGGGVWGFVPHHFGWALKPSRAA